MLEIAAGESVPSHRAGGAQRRFIIFVPLSLELFLGRLEIRDARGDFLALARQSVLLFAGCHPLPIQVCGPVFIGVRD